jgi:hypothetical protein
MTSETLTRPSYEGDYYLWALDQARRLRAMTKLRPNVPIDWELVAEEVEELGRNERHACESWVEQIIAHLLKLEHSALRDPRDHWRGEVTAFRLDLARKLTPSIERLVRQQLNDRWRAARLRALRSMTDAEPELERRLPKDLPYSFEQITGDWLPERA